MGDLAIALVVLSPVAATIYTRAMRSLKARARDHRTGPLPAFYAPTAALHGGQIDRTTNVYERKA
jgi:hypothetical protein